MALISKRGSPLPCSRAEEFSMSYTLQELIPLDRSELRKSLIPENKPQHGTYFINLLMSSFFPSLLGDMGGLLMSSTATTHQLLLTWGTAATVQLPPPIHIIPHGQRQWRPSAFNNTPKLLIDLRWLHVVCPTTGRATACQQAQ